MTFTTDMKFNYHRKTIPILIGGILLALSFLNVPNKSLLLFSGILAVMIGVTDYGRSCPLFMSLRFWLARLRTQKVMTQPTEDPRKNDNHP